MSDAATAKMTVEQFLGWQSGQEWRWELVDGRPVAMTGATFAHDRVVGNIRNCLSAALRATNSQCDAFGADIGVAINRWTLRRPDVAVYCPPWDETAVKSDRPRLVVEVSSRSTEQIDAVTKLKEYKSISAIRTILMVDPRVVAVGVWSRRQSGDWGHESVTDIEARVEIVDLGIILPVRDIYERVSFGRA